MALDLAQRSCSDEPAITTAMRDGLPAGARLEYLNTRLKSVRSLARKIKARATGGTSASEAAAGLTDTVRYTVACDDAGDMASVAVAHIQALKAHGCTIERADHSYGESAIYRGVHVILRSPGEGGTCFEVQYHTTASLDAKNQIHPLYEEERVLSEDQQEERRALQARMAAISAGVPTPDIPGLAAGLENLGGSLVEKQR